MRASVPCFDERPCFARNGKSCNILNRSYRKDDCPFCKPRKEYTHGVHYPFDSAYQPKEGKG